jgi:hypothetical protein
MTEPKIYPLRLSKEIKTFIPGMLAIFTIVGFLIPFAKTKAGGPPPQVFAVFWLGVLVFMWYRVLSLPLKIVHHPDDRLEFRSIIRNISVQIRDLQIIEPVRSQFGFFYIRHSGGKIFVLIHFDGFHELLTNIKSKNPNIQFLGC